MNVNCLSVSEIRKVDKLFIPFSNIEELERYDRFVKELDFLFNNPEKRFEDTSPIFVISQEKIVMLLKKTPKFDLDTIVKYWVKKGIYSHLQSDPYMHYNKYYEVGFSITTSIIKEDFFELCVIVEHFNVKIDMYDAYQRIKQRVINGRSEPISQRLSDEYERYLRFIDNYRENHQYYDDAGDFRGLQIEKKFKLKTIIEIFIKIECRAPLYKTIFRYKNYRYLLDYFIER